MQIDSVFSTLDEPLYNFLQQKSNEIEFINDIDEVPDLNAFDDENKNKPILIVFDDFFDFSTRILINRFNGLETFFLSLIYKNLRSRFMLELMVIFVSI